MSNKFTIGELSNILGIEKSTLRYWDKQGLIHLERNNDNNYREYTKNEVIEISDIAFYRSLNMPIKDLRQINTMKVEDLEQTFHQLEDSIAEEINRLESIKKNVVRRQRHIKKYYELMKHPFQIGIPDMSQMSTFDVHDKEAWRACLYDPYRYGIYKKAKDSTFYNSYIPEEEIELEKGVGKEGKKEGAKILWRRKEEVSHYLTCIVLFASGHYEENTFYEVEEYGKEKGLSLGDVVGRYLFSTYFDKKYDVHKVWVEVIGENIYL